MSKFSNILKMIKLLEGAKEPIKRKDIAEHLGVSERMVRKYVNDIKEANLGIISTPGKNGGYQIHQEQKSQEKKSQEQKSQEKKIKLTLDEYILIKSLLEQNRIEVNKQIEKISNDEYEDKKDYSPIKRILIRQLTDIQNINNKIKEFL